MAHKLEFENSKHKSKLIFKDTSVSTPKLLTDVSKHKLSSKLSDKVVETPVKLVQTETHNVLSSDENNSGAEAADKSLSAAEGVKNFHSNKIQKDTIKKRYTKAKYEQSKAEVTGAAETTEIEEYIKGRTKQAAASVKNYVTEHKKLSGVIAVIFIGVFVLFSTASSTSTIFGGSVAGIAELTTYPSDTKDMLKAEDIYFELEEELQKVIKNYEKTHNYNEYHYDLADIHHDPYILTSMLCAMHNGEVWTSADVKTEIQALFKKQYTLTSKVKSETRYRYENRNYVVYEYDDEGNVISYHFETEQIKVPYTYTICYLTLKNNDLSHLTSVFLNEDQMELYSAYMSTLGNYDELFENSEYIEKYLNTEYEHYDIPDSYMSDENFAKIMAEADKYVGMPYVFGGSNPSTSFDCSGYVCWVYNNSGWNIGRVGATALYHMCTPVTKATAKPGDLIFFEGTYDSGTLCSHVGIIVDPINKIMINAGDPIQYESYNTKYWNSHYYSCGRMPKQ